MTLHPIEITLVLATLLTCLTVGSLHVRVNIWLFAISTLLVAFATEQSATQLHHEHLHLIACLFAVIKGLAIPFFLVWTGKQLKIYRDAGTTLTAPLSMLLSVLLCALSFGLTRDFITVHATPYGWFGAATGISMLFSGLVLMLTRRLALSQIIGFLIIENGIYIFALTQTHGMPMLVEMGVLLDVLVAVMIAGLLIFRIQKSFEHIDVALLSELRE